MIYGDKVKKNKKTKKIWLTSVLELTYLPALIAVSISKTQTGFTKLNSRQIS